MSLGFNDRHLKRTDTVIIRSTILRSDNIIDLKLTKENKVTYEMHVYKIIKPDTCKDILFIDNKCDCLRRGIFTKWYGYEADCLQRGLFTKRFYQAAVYNSLINMKRPIMHWILLHEKK